VAFIGIRQDPTDDHSPIAFKGTAFIVAVPRLGSLTQGWFYLVTAKHVADRVEHREVFVRMNSYDGKIGLLRGAAVPWYKHPTDLAVDVAVLPFDPPDWAKFTAIRTDQFATDEIIRTANIGPGSEVFVTGLFTGHTGQSQNQPIIRTGNVAMMPADRIRTACEPMECYLIESRSIGGLSGSPVFVIDIGLVDLPPLIQPTTSVVTIRKFYLLGLIQEHWDLKPGEIVDTDEDNEKVNMGIAIVVPAKSILEVLGQPAVVAKRGDYEEGSKAGPKG
jgi:hypothetical protein